MSNLIKIDTGLVKRDASLMVANKLLKSFDDNLLDLIPYRKGDKWGFCKRNKRIEIDCMFDRADPFSEGLSRVKYKGKWGYIDRTGNSIVQCVYDDLYEVSCDMIKFALKDKNGLRTFGFLDKKGQIVISPMSEYYSVGSFVEDLACVRTFDGKWGFIDKSGNAVIPCIYEFAHDFSEGLACVKQNEKYGFINTSGELEIPCNIGFADNFNDGIAEVFVDGQFGFLNKQGRIKFCSTKYNYSSCYSGSGGLRSVIYDGKYGFINFDGELIIPCIFEHAFRFSEGFARVASNKKFGFIDSKAELVIPYIYENAKNVYSEHIVGVKVGGKWGYIDANNKVIIEPKYYGSWMGPDDFSKGLANVWTTPYGNDGYIDRRGTEYWED